jgi:diguanylate cyclase (GGDEF)-like protein
VSGLITSAAVATAVILAVALVITRLGAQRTTRDLQQRLAEAERAAHTDPLTGMSNRAGLYKALEQQRESARPGDHIAVILLDLDGLKQTNDMYGHDFGDSVIVEVAQRIERVAGHAACAARLGGDEFVVLMHAETSNSNVVRDAELLAERMCARIARSELVSGMPIRCTASAGVAAMPAHRMHQLLTAADKAMYRAKSTRAGTYRYQPADDATERIPHRRHPLVPVDGSSGAEAPSSLA